MTYALDTNIISYMLKGDKAVMERYRQEESGGHDFVILANAFYEVQRGLLAGQMTKRLQAFEILCQKVEFIELDKAVWQKYGNDTEDRCQKRAP